MANVPKTMADKRKATIMLCAVKMNSNAPRLNPCAAPKPISINSNPLALNRSAAKFIVNTNTIGKNIMIQVNGPPAYRNGIFIPMYANIADTNNAVVILVKTSLK
jgi:hypothetical protein